MAVETHALARALGLRSPRWAVERDLMTVALSDLTYGSDGARRALRLARERTAARSGRTERPTVEDFRAALGGSPEQRIGVLVRLFLAECEDATHTKEVSGPEGRKGGPERPPLGPVGHEP